MNLLITAFFMAWGMFWIIPCPLKRWDERSKMGMLLFLPVIGLLIGLVWAVLGALLELAFPRMLCAGVMTAVPYILSGFIHLDGYMDCADAVLSRRDLETRRKILKDSHVGSFAVIAVCLLFLLTFSALAGEPFGKKLWALPFVCAVPRACSTLAVLTLKPLSGSSYEKMFASGVPGPLRWAAGSLLVVLLVLPVLLFGRAGLCGFIGAAGYSVTVAYIRADLGGMSGDVSGAGITLGELFALVALALL